MFLHFARPLIASMAALLGCAAFAQAVSPTAPPASQVATRFYQDIGRISWQLPSGEYFFWAVPHFTQGPRLLCGAAMHAECEIQVSARALTTERQQRRADLIAAMQPYKAEAKETSIEVLSAGLVASPIEYASLTHKVDGGRVAVGHYVKGPFAIKFRMVGRDPDGGKLQRLLSLLASATPLDGEPYLAFKLADDRAACDVLAPDTRLENERAWKAFPLSHVDYRAYLMTAKQPGLAVWTAEELDRTQRATLEGMRGWDQTSLQSFCKTLPAQLAEAMR